MLGLMMDISDSIYSIYILYKYKLIFLIQISYICVTTQGTCNFNLNICTYRFLYI